jgi:uncharacterized membrane protein
MRWHGPAALACLVGGIAALAVAVAQGGAQVHLLLVVPVVTGSSPLALAGILGILAAMVLGFTAVAGRALPPPAPASPTGVAGANSRPPAEGASPAASGVIFLGPFPIVFGSSPSIARTTLILAIALFALLVAFYVAVLTGLVRLI